MASITNYSTLVDAVKDLAEDDGAEFSNFIPTAIQLAHFTLIRVLDLPDAEKIATGSLAYQSNILAKPLDYRIPKYFSIVSNNKKTNLRLKSNDYINDYWPDSSVTATPKYYSDLSKTEFLIAPTPDLSYTYELKYVSDINTLSATITTNYFTDNCPDILLAAVMYEMSKFMKAWSQVTTWENEFTALKDTWNFEMSRKRRDNGSFPLNVEGPNTVKHTINSNA